ncbi:MAG: hypothetical protein U1E50_12850 [Caulobacteraceae bacterium]
MSEISLEAVAPQAVLAPAGSPAAAPDEDQSAVAWGAVFAGAVAALGMTTVVAALAAGLGYGFGGPFTGARITPDDFNPYAGAAMVTAQVLSAALGGYLAGRLRTKWRHVHTHEVFFRDTTHGLLAWAFATVVMAALAGLTAAHPAADAVVATSNEAEKTAQFAFFLGVGLLTSAFIACVTAAIGGGLRDEMHARHRETAR